MNAYPVGVSPSTLASPRQLRALGIAWPPTAAIGKVIEEHAVRIGVRLDFEATIECLRVARAFAQRQRAETRSFAAKWNAPIDDVTDLDDERGELILMADAAIAALEKTSKRVRMAGPLPELEEDRVEALQAEDQARRAASQIESAAAVAPAPAPAPARIAVVRASPDVVPPAGPLSLDAGPLPTPVRAKMLEVVAKELVRATGLAWPDGVPSTVRGDETIWTHAGVTFAIVESVEYQTGPFDSPDRYWSAYITGLPGGCSLRFHASYGDFGTYTLTGDATQKAAITRALESAFSALIRAHATVSRGILAPEAWCARAATLELGRPAPVLHIHRWSLEPLDASGGGWFAVATNGEMSDSRGPTVDPIGPLPRVLGIAYVTATRSAPSARDTTPPSVEQLGAVLAGVAPPTVPEEVRDHSYTRARRFRAGPWVFQDEIYGDATAEKLGFMMRVQSEQGGTHAALVHGAYNRRGWGELTFELIGAPASREEMLTRLEGWAAANDWGLVYRWVAD